MTQVKICGITNKEDALFAAKCGAAALGFIFYLPSPRYIKPEDAKQIIRGLPGEVIKVGVFVNEKAEEIKKVVKYCAIDMIQLHGDESPLYCRQFPASIIIKAVELKNDDHLGNALCYDVAAIMVDSRHAGLYGGTGKKANWELACAVKNKRPLILSGGLNEENIAEALRTVNPAALDLNSGIEVSPGKKDHAKLVRIFDIIRTEETAPENSLLIFSKRNI
ncbi:MAG: phosphoribosylanthranilate isomerase [Smithella sp.]